MKKSNLIKVCSILLIVVMMTLALGTTVNAAETGNFTDMTDSLRNGNTNTNGTGTNGTNTNGTNTNGTNTNGTNTNGTSTNGTNTNGTNTNGTSNNGTTNNNSSVYNNNNLPKTGIESSIPVALLVVIFAISSVYAYKKINDYKEI